MTKAGEIMEGTAVFRGKVRAVRIKEGQGDDVGRGFFEGRIYRASSHQVARPGFFPKQRRHQTGIDGAGSGLHGDGFLAAQEGHGSFQAENGRNSELAGHIGQVARDAALFGDYGGGP